MITKATESGSCSKKTDELIGSKNEGIDKGCLVSVEIAQNMSEVTVGCCTDKNGDLSGIEREGCFAEITISSGVVI